MQATRSSGLKAVLAKNVRKARLSLGLSQEAFADACGLHRTYIGAIERAERNVSLSVLERLAMGARTEAATLLLDQR